MAAATSIDDAFEEFDEMWAPRVLTRVNDYDVRIAKVAGDHAWHTHDHTDEFFRCLTGRFTVEMRQATVEMRQATVVLGPGEVFTVPRPPATATPTSASCAPPTVCRSAHRPGERTPRRHDRDHIVSRPASDRAGHHRRAGTRGVLPRTARRDIP